MQNVYNKTLLQRINHHGDCANLPGGTCNYHVELTRIIFVGMYLLPRHEICILQWRYFALTTSNVTWVS